MKAKLKAIEHRAVSGNWLLGDDYEEIAISDDTYSWLWGNIYNICDTPRLVKMFWANSNQYFDFKLRAIREEIDFQQNKVANQTQIEARRIEQRRFLEFHYALGGLLLYRKQYATIKYMFEYSQTIPPQHVLLPERMDGIFYWFEHFSNEFKHSIPIDSRYYFPGLDNLGNRQQINYWICSYIALLFIRQYSLQQYYVYQNFTAPPALSNNVLDLGNLLQSISYFQKCLEEVQKNEDLIKELDYMGLVEANLQHFDKFVNGLKNSIKEQIGKEELNAQLSEAKIKNFYLESDRIITEAFGEYESLFVHNGNTLSADDFRLTVSGQRILMPKSLFTNNDIPNENAGSFFAESIATQIIKKQVPNAFFSGRTKRYLLNENNLIAGLSKIIGHQSDIIIVGVSLNDDIEQIIEESKLRFTAFYSIISTEYSTHNTLFLLGQSDLPAIEYKKLQTTVIEKHHLKRINNKLNLFASVIDINTKENEPVKEDWKMEVETADQDPKVQVALLFDAVIYWKKDREVIQINIASEYIEQGIPTDIKDLQPLKEREGKK